MALYVYGLMRADDGGRAVGEAPADGLALEMIGHAGLCALVSTVSDEKLALARERALSHSQTLQAAFEHGPVLPLRFGTIVADAAALERDFLAPRAQTMLARLDALQEMAEMQVRATYLEEPLLRSILAESPSLSEAAVRLRDLPAAATHFDRIALGEAISEKVHARRQIDAQHLLDALTGLAVAVSASEPAHERGVLNASFLVVNDRLEEFDGAVEELSERYGEQTQFRLIGPMPAYSFSEQPWEERLADAARSGATGAERSGWG